MKRSLVPLTLLALTLTGCDGSASPSSTPSPTSSGSPGVAPSPSPSEPVSPEPNVTCNDLSFYLDPMLAVSVTCETVPEEDFEFEPWPEHTRVTLQGYPLVGTFHDPHIAVYPVAEYVALAPNVSPQGTTALGNLAAGTPVPAWSPPSSGSLPFLPLFNAAQMFYSHYSTVSFGSGDGIRYLTQFTQAPVLVNNAEVFYTFQGLTADGQYWVSVVLPVSHVTLPDDGDSLPNGMTWEELAEDFDALLVDAVADLSLQPEGSFLPTIATLDSLVASITVAS